MSREDAGDNFIVITGGPGSGTSTLIDALAASGLRHMPEAGRAIIQDQVAIGGAALPWADRSAFAELMLGCELRSWREASALSGITLFDRGVPDVVGYLTLSGLTVPQHVRNAAALFRYNRRVFIAPPWQAIFGQDTERRQTWEEAEATYHVMVDVYSALDYELVDLPLATIEDRARFVRNAIT